MNYPVICARLYLRSWSRHLPNYFNIPSIAETDLRYRKLSFKTGNGDNNTSTCRIKSEREFLERRRLSAKIQNVHTINQKSKECSGTVIFLHGSGGSGMDVMYAINELLKEDAAFEHINIILPTAPLRPYTPLNKLPSNVWFDRLAINPFVPEEFQTLDDSAAGLKKLIQAVVDDGVPPNRIIIGGHSMGGAMAMHMAYRHYWDIAGVFALSSFLNDGSAVFKILNEQKPLPDSLPHLFQTHGDHDELVKLEWGKKSFDQLNALGVKGEFHVIPNGTHDITAQQLRKLYGWINNKIPK